jgi:hypothetical protein
MFVRVGAVQSGGLEQLLNYNLIGTWESVDYVDEGRTLVATPPTQSPYVIQGQNKPILFSELCSLPVVLSQISVIVLSWQKQTTYLQFEFPSPSTKLLPCA